MVKNAQRCQQLYFQRELAEQGAPSPPRSAAFRARCAASSTSTLIVPFLSSRLTTRRAPQRTPSPCAQARSDALAAFHPGGEGRGAPSQVSTAWVMSSTPWTSGFRRLGLWLDYLFVGRRRGPMQAQEAHIRVICARPRSLVGGFEPLVSSLGVSRTDCRTPRAAGIRAGAGALQRRCPSRLATTAGRCR